MDSHPSSLEESGEMSIARRIDEVCALFQAAWEAGDRPHVESFLNIASENEQADLLRELLRCDVANRRRLGEDPKPREYHQRFPRAKDVIVSVFGGQSETHRSVASTHRLAKCSPADQQVCCPTCRREVRLTEGGEAGQQRCDHCGCNFRISPDATVAYMPADCKMIGHFLLQEKIGHGSFGTVWKALDIELDRTVAVKVPTGRNLRLSFRSSSCAKPGRQPN